MSNLFLGCLDERTTALGLSVMFHQKAEQYVENVPKWNGTIDDAVGNTDNSSEASSKDASITGHSSGIPSLGKINSL